MEGLGVFESAALCKRSGRGCRESCPGSLSGRAGVGASQEG